MLRDLSLAETVQDMLHLGLLVVDEEQLVLSCNDWLVRAGGLDPQAVVGRSLLDVFPSIRNKRLSSAVCEVLEYGRPVVLSQALNKCPLPLVSHHADGQGVPMQQAISLVRIVQGGAGNCCLIQVNDVTPMVARERRLRQLTRNAVTSRDELQSQAERLDALNLVLQARSRDLANFAHAAAHDLKAPMRHMAGLARILQEDLDGKLEPDSVRHMQLLVEAGSRGARVVEDLLRFAEAQRPRDLYLLDLTAILEQALSNLQGEVDKSKARVSFEPLGQAIGYQTGLMLVFQNLISNALKYCEAKVPEVHVTSRVVDNQLEVRVLDNGLGVDEGDKLAIFEPFRRVHGDVADGSGIGLATCQRIVADSGGRIWIEPQEQGSAFLFTCPLE